MGWPLALQNPDDELVLPHFGVDNWVPQAQVEYITNQVDLGAVSLTKLDFRYRWRYLNQTILGTAGSKTLSATPETAAQATLSGATLYLPQSQFDSEFTRIPVKIHKITLGNTSYETATVVQYLRITTQANFAGRVHSLEVDIYLLELEHLKKEREAKEEEGKSVSENWQDSLVKPNDKPALPYVFYFILIVIDVIIWII